MNLDELRTDCATKQKKGLHIIIIASVVIWVAVLCVHLTGLPILTKNFVTFCCTAPLLPLSFFISKIKQVGNYPCKTGHFPAFLLDRQPQILLIYYWRLSLDTPKIQEMQSYSFDWTSLPLYNEAKKGR